MVAESNPVRRLRRLFATGSRTPSSAGSRPGRRGAPRWIVAASIVAAGLVTVGAAVPIATAMQAPAAAPAPAVETTRDMVHAETDGEVGLHLAPMGGVAIDPSVPTVFGIEVVNGSAHDLAQGVVRLSVADDSIASVEAMDAWLADTSESATLVGETAVNPVASGANSLVTVGVPAGFGAEMPVVGMRAELIVDGVAVAASDTAVATTTASAAGAAGLAVAYPLTVPDETPGLIDADQLETWTQPAGLLTRELAAVANRQVAIGVDPRIIASIRVLGSSAPESALDWLTRLSQVQNVVFPLGYADADLAIQAQLALPGLLQPISFDDVLNAADFVDGVPVAATQTPGVPGPTATDGAAPSGVVPPTEPAEGDTAEDTTDTTGDDTTDGTTPLPTTEELLAWPYTRTDLAWPADDTVAAGDLTWLSAVGLTTTLLSPGNIANGEVDASTAGRSRANAATVIDGGSAVVADSRITPALRAAAAATSESAWREATAQLGAELAVLADPESPALSLLATFQRTGGAGTDRVAATLDAIAGMPWAQATSLSDVIGAPPVARSLASAPETDERRTNVQRMLDSEAATAGFATVLSDPLLLTAPTRRDLLAVLDASYVPTPVEWNIAVGEWLVAQTETRSSVSVVPSSTINVISRESGVPATVENRLPYPVTVLVDVAPSNGRLIVEDSEQITVEPESRASVIVPVVAGVGSGDVTLTVTLLSPTGVEIGDPSYFEVNVQADWEGVGATILATLAVLVFGLGLWRTIRKRRRARAEAGASAESDDAPESGDAPDSDDAPETGERDG